MKLTPMNFASATKQMVQHSGAGKTRVMLKLRAKDKSILVKSTDDKTTLTTSIKHQDELKLVEQIVNDYVAYCTKNAPQDIEGASPGSSKKNKKNKKK